VLVILFGWLGGVAWGWGDVGDGLLGLLVVGGFVLLFFHFELVWLFAWYEVWGVLFGLVVLLGWFVIVVVLLVVGVGFGGGWVGGGGCGLGRLGGLCGCAFCGVVVVRVGVGCCWFGVVCWCGCGGFGVCFWGWGCKVADAASP
ncbi:hypothetical protein, partial [Pseudomonas syringae group genomosp. 7]|uniref:hypothetical protein n=1 Tax=Pseudomonas syringae group genomosp. 7 TaxID=251699 RepID=UPI00376F79CA